LNFKKRDELVTHISNLLSSLSEGEKEDIFEEVIKTKPTGIPISVFKANLSGLGIIVKYLRENEGKSFKEISKILNRKLSTLYNTYNNSKIKFRDNLDISDSSITIPFDIFKNRKYSVLESIVVNLKKQNLSFTQISSLLNKKYSTIRTVYRRYHAKRVE